VITAKTAAAISEVMAPPDFDFTRKVVLTSPIGVPLVPARDMRMSLVRGGLHVSGHSDSTSIVVLPQQFSHCLLARDDRVRLVRANLMMTGMIFSGDVDTDIVFDYGIFTPRCRRADISDIKQLKMQIEAGRAPLSGGGLFPTSHPSWHCEFDMHCLPGGQTVWICTSMPMLLDFTMILDASQNISLSATAASLM
jgi:hypothetical protein